MRRFTVRGMAGAIDRSYEAASVGWPFGAAEGRVSVTICGSGNGAHALAVVASVSGDVEVDWLAGSEERARLLRAGLSRGGLCSTGAVAARADRIRSVSADPAAVIPGADVVLMLVPAFAHGRVLRRIAPYLSEGTAVGCVPARGAFEFEATRVLGSWARERPTVFGLQTLPWSTRVTRPGELVHIGAVKREVLLAALPATRAAAIARRLQGMLGTRVIPTGSFLDLTLGNPGQFIHPGLMYGHFRSWRGEEYDQQAIPLLYAQATEETGALVQRLSREAIAVADQLAARSAGILNLGGGNIPIHDWLRRAYGHATSDTSTVAACFRTGPIKARKAPMLQARPGKFVPNFGYRYLSEDVPFGLLATHALAELADVKTPAIDEVITWAQSALHRQYLAGDKLQAADTHDLRIPQNSGISTLTDLINWYSQHAATIAISRPPVHAHFVATSAGSTVV